jgi:hypothetical protein
MILQQIGLQLLMPTILLIFLWFSRPTSKLKWLTDTAVIFLALLFIFITARWEFISYYLRIVLFPLFFLASYVAYRKIVVGKLANSLSHRLRLNGVNIILILFFGLLNINVLRGSFYPGDAISLAYPLRDGLYYVGGGGNNRWINNHNAFPPQDYALDIIRLNAIGRPGSGDQTDLQQYAIFGEPIYSPCSGTVAAAVDVHPDQIPPNKDSVNIAGNYVLIACHDVEVLLAHMKQGSVAVAAGDRVEEWTVIGAVGNSGHTTQPHLHIHAERGGIPGRILDGQGVPITFNNRFLVRNCLFTGGKG